MTKNIFKILKNLIKSLRRDYKRDIKYLYSFAKTSGEPGYLHKRYLFKLAVKNVLKSKSRTAFTIVGIALGVATIVFLVSFAYGLQNIVEQRLVRPTSLRMVDVQSDSTKLTLNDKAMEEISKIEGVEDVAPSISVAGSVTILGSKTDVVVLGANNKFLEYSYLDVVDGKNFSDEAEAQFKEDTKIQEEVEKVKDLIKGIESVGDVKGAFDEQAEQPAVGVAIENGKLEKFRVLDYAYIPVRQKPDTNALIVGYMTGRLSESFEGSLIWGGMYRSVDTAGKAYQLEDGEWLGKWMKIDKAPMYKREGNEYIPLYDDEAKQEIHTEKGYVGLSDIYILTTNEIADEKALQRVLGETDSVYDQPTQKEEIENVYKVEFVDDLSADAETVGATKDLEAMVSEGDEPEPLFDFAYINILKPYGKEILLSSNLVKALKKSPNELIGKEIYVDLIINNGLIPGVNAKLLSQSNKYTVVGVFKDDANPIVILPFADFKSMGVDRYSVSKVLASDATTLSRIRDDIQILGFSTQSVVDTLQQVNKLFNLIRILLGFMGVMALVVAVVGMVNTLTVSLLERTREVGVMKTLGTTNMDVTKLFLIESIFIATVGGIGGIIFGIFSGVFVNLLVFALKRTEYVSLFLVPPLLVFVMVGIAVIIGIITGIYPAKRAGKISGLDAIRNE